MILEVIMSDEEKLDREQPIFRIGGITPYDGYRSPPIWIEKENDSTYFDSDLESQCGVPSKSLEELQKEFEIFLEEERQRELNEKNNDKNPVTKKFTIR